MTAIQAMKAFGSNKISTVREHGARVSTSRPRINRNISATNVSSTNAPGKSGHLVFWHGNDTAGSHSVLGTADSTTPGVPDLGGGVNIVLGGTQDFFLMRKRTTGAYQMMFQGNL